MTHNINSVLCKKDCKYAFHHSSLFKHDFCNKLKYKNKSFRTDTVQLCCYAEDFNLGTQSGLFVMHQNMRSIDRNIKQLQLFIESQKQQKNTLPDTLAVTETWLSDDQRIDLQKYTIPGYKTEHATRKVSNRGGVGVYITGKLVCG